MTLTFDHRAELDVPPYRGLIDVPQAYLTLISGTLYELDTDQFWRDCKAEEASQIGIVFQDTLDHAGEQTVAGVTYAQFIRMYYAVQFEDTGSAYSVRLAGSNNDIFDQDNGILIPTPLVTVISTNSAGLIVTAQSGLTTSESEALTRIDEGVYGQKIMQPTASQTAGTPGTPGYILMYDDTADPDDSGTWVLLGHKPIWIDKDRTVGWFDKTDPIGFEGALVAGPPPP